MSSGDAPRRRRRPPETENASEKRLWLMTCFSSQRPRITAAELGRTLGLSTASVEELAIDLVRAGLLKRDSNGAYLVADKNPLPITVRDERRSS